MSKVVRERRNKVNSEFSKISVMAISSLRYLLHGDDKKVAEYISPGF